MDTNTSLIDNLEENEETKFMYEIIEGYANTVTDLYLRIDNAIEYIEKNLAIYHKNLPLIAIDYEEIINILKGEENGK